MALSAVILAGGLGRRMGGRNKALLPIGNEAFIKRQIRKALPGTDEIIVVSNDRALYDLLKDYDSVRVIPDQYAGEGPLAGIHAGLAAAAYPNVWVIGCDQPFLDVAAANFLRECMESQNHQAAIPVIGGKLQPLHAIYRKETGALAEGLLLRGERRLLALLDVLHWRGIEEQEFQDNGISTTFTNDVDTPEQYASTCLLIDEND